MEYGGNDVIDACGFSGGNRWALKLQPLPDKRVPSEACFGQ